MLKLYSTNNNVSLFDGLFKELLDNDYQYYYSPNVDIIENDNNYTIELSLPGFTKKNIKLNVEKNNNLIITGERKRDDNIKFNKKQTFYGKFKKSFLLPDDVNKENINAKMENGILYVNINKTESMKPISINIE